MVDCKAFLKLVTLGYLVPAIALMPESAAASTEQPDGGYSEQHGGGRSEPPARPLDRPNGQQPGSGGNGTDKPRPGPQKIEAPPERSESKHGGGMSRERNPSGRESGRSAGRDGTPSRRTIESGRDRDDWQIRNAVRNGDAEPLRRILSVVRERYDGKVVRITLGGKGRGLHYRIRILGRNDRLIEVKVNARTATILSVAGL